MTLQGEATALTRAYAPPAPYPTMVWREGILLRMAQRPSPQALVVRAPGGFGKTTLLLQWAARDPRPTVWLALGPETADASSVAQRIVRALGSAGLLTAGGPTVPDTYQLPIWQSHALPALAEVLNGVREPVLLVLDDVSPMIGEQWDSLAAIVAASLPAGSTLAITTREGTPPSLLRLLPAGLLLQLTAVDLVLGADEAAAILRRIRPTMRSEDAAGLLAETQGWPVALALVASQPSRRPGGRAVLSYGALADYLRNEVVARLSPDTAAFLLRVSIVEELDGEICDAVTASSGSLALLRRLSASSGLLVPLDEAGTRFRLHPLLRHYLAQDFAAADPQGWERAHTAAACVRAVQGQPDVAVGHARAAGDGELLAAICWRQAPLLLASGRFAVLRRWLGGFSQEDLSRVVDLAVLDAWVASHEGDMARKDRMLAAAQALVGALPAPERGRACARDVLLLHAALGHAGLHEMAAHGAAFLAEADPDDPWRAVGHYLVGVAAALRADSDRAHEQFLACRRVALMYSLPLMEAHAEAGLADVAFAVGDTDRGLRHAHAARALVHAGRLDFIPTAAPILVTSTRAYLAEGRFHEARHEAAAALRSTTLLREGVPWLAVHGRLMLAEAFLRLGDDAQARQLISEADEAALDPTGRSPVLDAAREACRALLAERKAVALDEVLTSAELRVLQYLPTHLTVPQIAEEMFVSRHTVKTQVMAVYRKLGVHTRADAIAVARERGMLNAG